MVRLALVVAGLALCPPALAQEQPQATLRLDLNAAEDSGGACRLTFVAQNRLGADLEAAVFEAVFFTAEGVVDRLTLLDFQALPQGRERVRQFDLPAATCAGFGRVLINAAQDCRGAGLDKAACMAGLAVSSRLPGLEIAG